MKAALQFWGMRFLWILLITLLYPIVMGLDFAWNRSHIPVRFRQANWEGWWKSRRFWGSRGRLLVFLPEPIPDGIDFKVEAVVYYPIYGVWRAGQFVRMEFIGHLGADSPATGGRTRNTIPSGGGIMKFKGYVGSQDVEYAALLDQYRTQMVGGYLSRNPDDFGHFGLSRY